MTVDSLTSQKRCQHQHKFWNLILVNRYYKKVTHNSFNVCFYNNFSEKISNLFLHV